ncbi:MAG: divalent-cation tolerance protein CutA [Luteolibacter sp.]
MDAPDSSGADRVMMVFCTFPERGDAVRIGTALVESGLAACVNVLPGVESIYRWEGKTEKSEEVLTIFKIPADRFADFEKALSRMHPYYVPEIVGINADSVSQAYAKWVCGQG